MALSAAPVALFVVRETSQGTFRASCNENSPVAVGIVHKSIFVVSDVVRDFQVGGVGYDSGRQDDHVEGIVQGVAGNGVFHIQ